MGYFLWNLLICYCSANYIPLYPIPKWWEKTAEGSHIITVGPTYCEFTDFEILSINTSENFP